MTQQQPSNHIPEAKKMVPGDELHLTLLMAPFSLNFFTGQDRQHLLAFGRAAFEAGQAAAQQAVQSAAPLPLLLRDIARDLGITVPQACIALKPLGNYSTNSAVTAEMARMLRDHFPVPAHPAEGVPAQDAELDIGGLIDRLLDAQQDLNLAANVHMDQSIASASTLLDEVEIALRTLAATHPTQQGMDAQELLAALGDLSFACFGGIGTKAPDAATYNRTFAVLQKHRDAAQAKQGAQA